MTALPRPSGLSASPRADAPVAGAESISVSSAVKSREPVSRLRRRIISLVLVLFALVSFWPAQYGGLTGLTVVPGKSMEPTYFTGDLVVSIRLPEYKVGDVISYLVPVGQTGAGTRILHRITEIDKTTGGAFYTTSGDNNFGAPDPWMIGQKDVMGTALFVLPGFGTLLGGMSNPLLVALILSFMIVVVVWSADPRNSTKRKAKPAAAKD
jgi:signal peptidase I